MSNELSTDAINRILLSACYSSGNSLSSEWAGVTKSFPFEGSTEQFLEELFQRNFAALTCTASKTNTLRILSLSCGNGLGIEIPLLSVMHHSRRIEKYTVMFHGIDNDDENLEQFTEHVEKEHPAWRIHHGSQRPSVNGTENKDNYPSASSTASPLQRAYFKLTVAQALYSVPSTRNLLSSDLPSTFVDQPSLPSKTAHVSSTTKRKLSPYHIKLWKFSNLEDYFYRVNHQRKRENPSYHQFLSTFQRITKLLDTDIDTLSKYYYGSNLPSTGITTSRTVTVTDPPHDTHETDNNDNDTAPGYTDNKTLSPSTGISFDPYQQDKDIDYWGKYHLIILNHNLSFYPVPYHEPFYDKYAPVPSPPPHPLYTTLPYIFHQLLQPDGILIIFHRQGTGINYIRSYTLHMLHEYSSRIHTTVPYFFVLDPLYPSNELEKVLQTLRYKFTVHSVSAYIDTSVFVQVLDYLLSIWTRMTVPSGTPNGKPPNSEFVSGSTCENRNNDTGNTFTVPTATTTVTGLQTLRSSRTAYSRTITDTELPTSDILFSLTTAHLQLLTVLTGIAVEPLWKNCLQYLRSIGILQPMSEQNVNSSKAFVPLTTTTTVASLTLTDAWILECVIKLLLLIDIASIHQDTVTAVEASPRTSPYVEIPTGNKKVTRITSRIPVPTNVYIVQND